MVKHLQMTYAGVEKSKVESKESFVGTLDEDTLPFRLQIRDGIVPFQQIVCMIYYSCTVVFILGIRLHTPCISCASRQARGKFDRMKWQSAVETTPCTYPVHGSASEVKCSGADTQVVSCHHYFVVYSVHV